MRKQKGMRFASIAEIKDRLSSYLARARNRREAIVVTHHGKPWALIQPLEDDSFEEMDWGSLRLAGLARAWDGEGDELYDYL